MIMTLTKIPRSRKPRVDIPATRGVLDTFHPIGFMGYRLDKASECYILGNGYRMYNPIMRAFYSPDSESPFGAGGVSRYAYCRFDPVNFSDPGGHISVGAGIGIGLGILGILLSGLTLGTSLSLLSAGLYIAGGFGVASAVLGGAGAATGIASAVLEESDPTTSAALGWASLGLGIASIVTGIAGTSPWLSGRFFKPPTLYRGDLRRLSEITNSGGFKGLGKNTSVTTHLSGRNAGYSGSPLEKSAYVSFSASRNVATDFVKQRMASEGVTKGYLYQIKTSEVQVIKPDQHVFSRSNNVLLARSRIHQEFLAKNVPSENITLIETFG
ncbi:RHS repeat-associated core domain-containing protein [Enterobacter asburiae]